jgi:hypothetical protein
MKKTYSLQIEGKNPDRVLDATKHDVRKYVKRCRAVKLPEGVDFWDFDCKVGADKDSAQAVHLADVTKPIDALAQAGHTSVYVEIQAKAGHRVYIPSAEPAHPEGDNPEQA